MGPSKPMKFALTLCIIALFWIVGYLAEPSLRPYILPKQGSGEGVVVVTPKIDLNTLTPSQLPERVTLMEDFPFVSASKLSITIPAGTSVKVKNIAAGRVFVMLEEATTTVGIPFEKTNLMEQVVARLESGQAPQAPAVQPTPVVPPTSTPTPTEPPPVTPPPAVTPPQPEPMVNPIPEPAVVTPAPTVTPPVPTPIVENPPASLPPEPTPAPTPTPPPAPEDNFPNDGPVPLVAAGALSDDGLVQLMQQHIKSGALKAFTFEQVTDWKAGPTENINGTPVQTGTVTYTHQSIFGPKQLRAKAYMLRGRVLRWVLPESGLVLE